MPVINDIQALYLGTTEIVAAYLGATQVYSSAPPPVHRFGNDVILGATGTANNSTDRAWAGLFNLDRDINLTEMGVYFTSLDSGNTGDPIKIFVANNNSGVANTIIYMTDPVTVGAVNAWTVAPLEGFLPAGNYWLGWVSDGFVSKGLTRVGTGNLALANGTFNYDSPPAVWPGNSATYEQLATIYAEGTEV